MDTFRARVAQRFEENGIELTAVKLKAAVQSVWDSIVDECQKEGKLSVRDFGTFYVHRRPARTVKNPATGEKHKRKADGLLRLKCRVPMK